MINLETLIIWGLIALAIIFISFFVNILIRAGVNKEFQTLSLQIQNLLSEVSDLKDTVSIMKDKMSKYFHQKNNEKHGEQIFKSFE
jgi:hypothetical protein